MTYIAQDKIKTMTNKKSYGKRKSDSNILLWLIGLGLSVAFIRKVKAEIPSQTVEIEIIVTD